MAAITAGPDTTSAATSTDATAATATTETKSTETTAQDWRTILTDEGLKKDATLARYKTADEAAKAIIEQHKALSSVITKIPGKDAKPEEIAAFREKLGVPKDPSGYDFAAIKGLPVDEAKMAQIVPVFHGIGLTNDQANQLAASFYEVEKKWKAQEEEGFLTEHDKLADTMGELVYNKHVQQVQRLVKKFADADTIAWLERSGYTRHPGLFKMLYPIAEQFAQDGFIAADTPGGGSTLSEVSGKLNDLRAKLAKMERGSPEYKALLSEYEQLNALEADLMRK